MTGLWTGSDGEARPGSAGLVGVRAPRHVLPRHGRGLGGGVRCTWAIGACVRVVSEVRGRVWVQWLDGGAHGLASLQVGRWHPVITSPCHDVQERERDQRGYIEFRGDGKEAGETQGVWRWSRCHVDMGMGTISPSARQLLDQMAA